MEDSGVISEYAESLARGLSFDRSLARCVRQEVEDHLWEAVATNSTGGLLAAQRRAIADFGDAHVIAAQIALVSLAKQIKKIGVTVVLMVATVFLAMTTRVTWYDPGQSALCADRRALSETVGLIDVPLSGWQSSAGSRLGPTSAAAALRPPSIRHIASSFAVSFFCARWQPADSSPQ